MVNGSALNLHDDDEDRRCSILRSGTSSPCTRIFQRPKTNILRFLNSVDVSAVETLRGRQSCEKFHLCSIRNNFDNTQYDFINLHTCADTFVIELLGLFKFEISSVRVLSTIFRQGMLKRLRNESVWVAISPLEPPLTRECKRIIENYTLEDVYSYHSLTRGGRVP